MTRPRTACTCRRQFCWHCSPEKRLCESRHKLSAVSSQLSANQCSVTALSRGERVSRCRRFHQPERDGPSPAEGLWTPSAHRATARRRVRGRFPACKLDSRFRGNDCDIACAAVVRFLKQMSIPAEKSDRRLMRQMFGAIAPRYNFVTSVFSYGMDRRWKQARRPQGRPAERGVGLGSGLRHGRLFRNRSSIAAHLNSRRRRPHPGDAGDGAGAVRL